MSARLIGRAAGVIHCYHKRRRARTLAPVSAYGGGASVQIGVDIGGTFTDIVALDDEGRLAPDQGADHAEGPARAASPTPSAGCSRWPARAPGGVERFIHGTTVATNAILEQKGAVTGVLTTEGFEDVLELGRQKRSRMYDLDMDPETPDVPRPAAPPGRDPRAARRPRPGPGAARRGPGASGGGAAPRRRVSRRIAVCYLFSFVNPAHERRTREIIREVAPGDQRLALVRGRSRPSASTSGSA